MKSHSAKEADDTQLSSSDSAVASSRALRIVIAGGVTGGHLFPGIAIAQEFMERNVKNSVIFAGMDRPFEISVLSNAGFEHKPITAQGIKGVGFLNKARAILKIPKGIFESIRLLRQFRPDIVVGVGGYVAGPVALAAWLLGIKIVLHEQNILPGITNRILSHFADRIYVSFADTLSFSNLSNTLFTGNPVRKEILECAMNQRNANSTDARSVPEQKPLFKILVIGGSQGAQSINSAVVEMLDRLMEKNAFHFTHQTGLDDEEKVKNAYNDRGISCTVKSFFSDMARQYQAADLVVCRAGATTVAEITVMGKGVIFIPFPHAADNHQVLNAQTLTRTGAAEMILEKDLSGESLAGRIEDYASNPETLTVMAHRASGHGKPDAARAIVDDCYRLIHP